MNSASPSLAELQRWFSRIATDPRGAESALEESRISPFAKEDRRGNRAKRLSIYAEAYFSRLSESLAGDFPALKRILEDSFDPNAFLRVVADFLKAHPSQTPNIGDVGMHLPKFIAEYEPLSDEPYLSELASVEWAVIEAYYSENTTAFNPDALAAIPPDLWQNVKFTLSPGLRTLPANWNVDVLWRDPAQESIRLDAPVTIAVWRNAGNSVVARLTADEILVHALIRAGKSLGEICEGWPGENTLQIMELFGRWITSGFLAGVKAET